MYAWPLSKCTSIEPLTFDAVIVETAMLPPDICVGEPEADVQTASTCAAELIDVLNAPRASSRN